MIRHSSSRDGAVPPTLVLRGNGSEQEYTSSSRTSASAIWTGQKDDHAEDSDICVSGAASTDSDWKTRVRCSKANTKSESVMLLLLSGTLAWVDFLLRLLGVPGGNLGWSWFPAGSA